MTSIYEKLKLLQSKAYSPYSNFQVAAILILGNGDEYAGVNVENASFRGTICAERSAFVSAISQQGTANDYQEIHLLAGNSENFAMPCGFCRQVINEFVDDDFSIIVYNNQGQSTRRSIRDLLPESFKGEHII